MSSGDGSTLVVFTNFFPFHRGEEYFETELPYLMERFSQVIIVPVMFESHMIQTRAVPDGVKVVAIDMPSGKLARARDTLRHSYGVMREGWLAGERAGIRFDRWAYEIYFSARCLSFWKRAEGAIMDAIPEHGKVVIYSYWLYVTAAESLLLRKKLGDRVIGTVSRAHRYDVVHTASRLGYLPQRRSLVGSLDRVFPVSNEGVECLVATVPGAADKTTVRRLGVVGPSQIRVRSNRKLTVVSCSSLKPVKRVATIVDSLRILAERGVPFEWTHFGGAGHALEELRSLAESGLPDGSWTLTGHVDNSVVNRFYSESTPAVFVNLSASEGVPVSIMEALANGIPVLATSVGGTPDIVHHGENGWLLSTGVGADEVARSLEMVSQIPEADFVAISGAARESWERDWMAATNYRMFAKELSEGVFVSD